MRKPIRRPPGGKIRPVVGNTCDHGHTIPLRGVSLGGIPWLGLFCPAGECRPSWRDPGDQWLVLRTPPGEAEEHWRMGSVRRSGMLPLVPKGVTS